MTSANAKGTESGSFQFRAFRLLYALGFSGFRVTGLISPQLPRRLLSSSRFFFFESFS